MDRFLLLLLLHMKWWWCFWVDLCNGKMNVCFSDFLHFCFFAFAFAFGGVCM